VRSIHRFWLKAYYWWLLAKYIPLVEKHKYLSIPLYVAARLTYNFVLGLLLVVGTVTAPVRALVRIILKKPARGVL
jgi:hypothetical protein